MPGHTGTEDVMHAVTSADGTPIAFSRSGEGPPVILVDGALCYRGFGPAAKLAARLSRRLTVFTYDRRGRGGSAGTAPSAPSNSASCWSPASAARRSGSSCVRSAPGSRDHADAGPAGPEQADHDRPHPRLRRCNHERRQARPSAASSRGAAVTISVLCADGGASRGWLRDGVRALA